MNLDGVEDLRWKFHEDKSSLELFMTPALFQELKDFSLRIEAGEVSTVEFISLFGKLSQAVTKLAKKKGA